MYTISSRPARQLSLPLLFIGGVALTLAGALAIFYLLLNPPPGELGLMAAFLSITAIISITAGYGLYRLGWINHSPHVSWTLLGGYALSSLLTFLNVWVTARLMFASQHDLLLATVLLLFAGGIAMSLGYFLSASLTARIIELSRTAEAIAGGQLTARAPVTGRDEMARLATTFNKMAEQLEEAAHKRQELERLRRELVTWVGHDLRTPLTSIRAIVEALADGMVEEPESMQRYLQTAQRHLLALSLLIDDLFEMAQLEAGGLPLDRQPNSLGDLISDTIESFRVLATSQGITLEGQVERGVDPLTIDAQKIGRVLTNLVSNALRHTPSGGTVRVAATAVGNEVRVVVEDTGEGISQEDLPKIFEQFYRGEKSRNRTTGGSGLGLAIARRIVEAHKGRIEAISEPERGTRIQFTLPLRLD